jgi:hypothetical protein
MSDAPYGLSKEASIQAHLRIAKKAIENGESDLRRAADHLAQAQEKDEDLDDEDNEDLDEEEEGPIA